MWDDGEPITADDVVFTMQVLVDENQNVPYSSYGFIDGQPVQAEKVDDRTVKLILPESSAGFLGGLSQVYCIPKHIYEGVENIGDSDLNNNPVGCGPFKFDEYKSGEYIRVVKNDKWFNDVNLDSITFRIIKDANSANAALASGDLDARLISADEYQTVSGYSNVNIYAYNSGRVNAMFLNQSTPALQDVRGPAGHCLRPEQAGTVQLCFPVGGIRRPRLLHPHAGHPLLHRAGQRDGQ